MFGCSLEDLVFDINDRNDLKHKLIQAYTFEGTSPQIMVDDRFCNIYFDDPDIFYRQENALNSIKSLIDVGDYNQAGLELNKYRKLYPLECEGMFQEALLASAMGNIDQALSLCKATIDWAPRHADALALMARILWDKGNVEDAKPLYQRAAQFNAYLAQNYIRDLYRSGRYHQAICLSQYCLEQEEQSAYFYFMVAKSYHGLQLYNKALEWALEALSRVNDRFKSLAITINDFIEYLSVEVKDKKNLMNQLYKRLSETQPLASVPVRLQRNNSLIPFYVSVLRLPNNTTPHYFVIFEEHDDAQGFSSALEQLLRLELSLNSDEKDLRELNYDLHMDKEYDKIFHSDTLGEQYKQKLKEMGDEIVFGYRKSNIDNLHNLLMLCTIGISINECIYNEFPDFRISQYLCLTSELRRLVEKTKKGNNAPAHVSCMQAFTAIYAQFIKRLFGYCDMENIDTDNDIATKYLAHYDTHRLSCATDYYPLIEYLAQLLGISTLVEWRQSQYFLPLSHSIL